jgi:hypothetical protein
MDILKASNFAAGKLLNGIDASSSSINIALEDAENFPQNGLFVGVLWSDSVGSPFLDPAREIVLANFTSAGSFSIVRAQEGTAAKDWDVFANFAHTMTAGTIQRIYDLIQFGLMSHVIITGQDDYYGSMQPVIQNYHDQMFFHVKFINESTKLCTLNINGNGPRKIYSSKNGVITQVGSGDIPNNTYTTLTFDASLDNSNGGWVLMSIPSTNAETLEGKSASYFAQKAHTHDQYSINEHNHNTVYASDGHNHNTLYAGTSHSHAGAVDIGWIKDSLKDPDPNTLGLRTLGTGANQAMPGNTGSLGVGQTWQDVKAFRSINVLYTNTTGKPISVMLQMEDGGTYDGVDVFVGGLLLVRMPEISSANYYLYAINFIVPNNTSYMVTAITNKIYMWNELR